jgi:uncharacterized protein (DUF952 family)
MARIYKILGADEWRVARAAGVFSGSAVDIADGYIHFSDAAQAPETAAKWFSERSDLVLLAVEATGFGDLLKWEPSRGGQLFPHLYAPLSVDAVVWAKPLPLDEDGRHLFPDLLA